MYTYVVSGNKYERTKERKYKLKKWEMSSWPSEVWNISCLF